MATHTPAQAIQELVNHTAVLTERLVGLQNEVRKGMASSPELGNAMTQIVGDTKRMLQAIEHLARLPAFHLDREGLNAAVAAGVQRGLAGAGGGSLTSLIEMNSRSLDEARQELLDSKKRMDEMLAEIQSAKMMSPESRKDLVMQFAPVVFIWSVAMVFVGALIGAWVAGGDSAAATTGATVGATPPPALSRSAPSAGYTTGQVITLTQDTPLYASAGATQPMFRAPQGARLTFVEQRPDGWIQVSFKTAQGTTGTGWFAPNALR